MQGVHLIHSRSGFNPGISYSKYLKPQQATDPRSNPKDTTGFGPKAK